MARSYSVYAVSVLRPLTLAGMVSIGSLVGCAVRPLPPYTARLVDTSGEPLPVMQRDGRVVTLGKVGQVFQVEVTNNTNAPVGVFLSVDGLDGTSGRKAAWEPAAVVYRRAHLFEAQTYAGIEGFDLTPTTKSSFGFVEAPQSFAALSKIQGDIGKIEVGIYALKPNDEKWPSRTDPADFAVSPLAVAAAPPATTPEPEASGKVTVTPAAPLAPYIIDGTRELQRIVLWYEGPDARKLGTVGPSPTAVTLGVRPTTTDEETEPDDAPALAQTQPESTTPGKSSKPSKPGKPAKDPGKDPSKSPGKSSPGKVPLAPTKPEH